MARGVVHGHCGFVCICMYVLCVCMCTRAVCMHVCIRRISLTKESSSILRRLESFMATVVLCVHVCMYVGGKVAEVMYVCMFVYIEFPGVYISFMTRMVRF